MQIPLQIEPSNGALADVDYRWDPDTDILSAQLRPGAVGEGASGAVEVEGKDGSWLTFDLTSGRIHGVEVAVWPTVQKFSILTPPAEVEDARAVVRARDGRAVASLEVNTSVLAEADHAERVIHFRLGGGNRARTVRLGRDLLLDLDAQSHLAGVWLLNVPPFPADS
ncbi:MAG TPA: hypothetical protein VGD77_02680 [Gemmatimonadaceae bacterium]